ncbi:MAG: hypothetical protein WDN44_09695 [Sphingomonas sp.]
MGTIRKRAFPVDLDGSRREVGGELLAAEHAHRRLAGDGAAAVHLAGLEVDGRILGIERIAVGGAERDRAVDCDLLGILS